MAVTRMRFHGTGGGTHYIDLNKALSVQLRKLHRQKVITTVYGGFFAIENEATTRISLNTAPNTWVTKRSINRGFASWRKMIAKTLSNTEGMQSGKWNDYKIYLNSAMGSGVLMPTDVNDNDLFNASGNTPEWDYSTLTTEDEASSGDQFDLMIVGQSTPVGGPAYTRVGLIESWYNSRPSVDPEPLYPDETATETDPLSNLFDAGSQDDDRLDIINAEGDLPPYDGDSSFGMAQPNGAGSTVGNNLQRQSIASCNASLQVAPVHGFEAICGLVQIAITAADENTKWELVLDVESKGVKF